MSSAALPRCLLFGLAGAVLHIAAPAVQEPLLDLRPQVARFGLYFRQASKEFVQFLWSQLRHVS